jgi:PIN domain nuclease of toxin-antitoxin system
MTVFLLDTCALLWWMADAPELTSRARRTIADRTNTIHVSAVSLWEIAIKNRRGRLSGVEEYLYRYRELHEKWGFATVVIEAADAVLAGSLDFRHSDPFDRMIIAQSRRLDAAVVTSDPSIRRQVKRCIW